MIKEYFFIYLIYGLVFISMGIFSIYKKEKELSNVPLVKSLKFLGLFGISHGLSEWVTMVVIADIYPEFYCYLFIIKQLLKAISFYFLIFFGITLMPIKAQNRKIIYKIPIILLIIWSSIFSILIILYGLDYHLIYPQYNIILLRYFMGLPGGIITGIALTFQSNLVRSRKLYSIAEKYKHLAYIFYIYGLVDGLFVREMEFFPANIINNQFFIRFFGFPIQIVKIVVGIAINILLIRVIETFGWEQQEKLKHLQQQKIAYKERRKLGLEIHDSIIQGIYAASLKLGSLINNNIDDSTNNILHEIKADLGDTIKKTREFISTTTLETVDLEDLKDSIEKLVKIFNESQEIKISIETPSAKSKYGELSAEKSSQIYYILQEAISNIIKHSKAKYGKVILDIEDDFMIIKVIDYGVGISFNNLNQDNHFGIQSMEERAKLAGGELKIKRITKGTEIKLIVPWEVPRDES